MTRYIASLLRSLREIQQSGDENHSITYSHQNMRSNDVALTRKGDSHLKTCRYIGKLACLAQSQPIANEDFPNAECIQPLARPPILEVQPGIIINEEIRHYLLQVYLTRIHCLYPFLNESMPPLAQTSLLTGDLDPWQKFILELIYAIACYGVDQDGYRTLAQDCHNRVLPNIDNATADITIYSLQAIPLLALHSLLEPQKGNAWQLIGFAGRLAMDLERHGSQNQETMMDRIYPSIYCIENQLATALDRPCFLPEPVGIYLHFHAYETSHSLFIRTAHYISTQGIQRTSFAPCTGSNPDSETSIEMSHLCCNDPFLSEIQTGGGTPSDS